MDLVVALIIELVVDSIVPNHVRDLVGKSIMVDYLVVPFIAQLKYEQNHDNVGVVNESLFVKNLDIYTSGGVSVDSDFLADMPSLKDVTPIVNNLQGFQHLNSPHCNFEVVPNFLMTRKARFTE